MDIELSPPWDGSEVSDGMGAERRFGREFKIEVRERAHLGDVMKRIAVLSLTLLASCSEPGENPRQAAAEAPASPACEPAVRIVRDVSVMFATEWLEGFVVVAICRDTEAETSDLSGFAKWLDEEARAERIRPCRETEESAVVMTDAERVAAERVLPGIRDWCLELIADI